MKNTDNHDKRASVISILKNRMNIMLLLVVIIFFTVGTIFMYPSIMSQDQQTASSVTINTSTTNPFGGVYEGPPQIVMVYNNTEHTGTLDSYSLV